MKKNMKYILPIICILFFYLDGTFGNSITLNISSDNVSSVKVFNGLTGESGIIEDEKTISQIIKKINSLKLKDGIEDDNTYNGWLYSIKFLDHNGNVIDNITIIDENDVVYENYKYSIDVSEFVEYIDMLSVGSQKNEIW